MTGQALILRADALRLPLADASVDLVVTSPPYWALRSYDAGPGEIGSEATPAEFLAALWAATAEMKRVLKPSGSIFVDLGDSYATAQSSQRQGGRAGLNNDDETRRRSGRNRTGIREKSLLLLPEAYRLGCTGMLAQLGGPDPGLDLIARSVTVWHKTNGLPESVDDRVGRSHEDWVHLVKSPRYYAAIDTLRQPHAARYIERAERYGGRAASLPNRTYAPGSRRDANDARGILGLSDGDLNPLGALPGSVWSIPSEPLDLPGYLIRLPSGVTMMDAGPLWRHVAWMRATGQPGPATVKELDHYAAFPSEWPRRLILGWSPPGICITCGQGRRPVARVEAIEDRRGRVQGRQGDSLAAAHGPDGRSGERYRAQVTISGYACACTPYTDHPGTGEPSPTAAANGRQATRPYDIGAQHRRVGPWREYHLDRWTPPPTRPAVVLDPFAGAGTTVAVARQLGRRDRRRAVG